MDSAHGDPCGPGCPIRTSSDQSLLAAPRGLSQPATSFIASWCQGIHRIPFEALDSPQRPCAGNAPPPRPRLRGTRRRTLPARERIRVSHAAGIRTVAGTSPSPAECRRLSTMSKNPPTAAARPGLPRGCACVPPEAVCFRPSRSFAVPARPGSLSRPAQPVSSGRLVEPNGIEPSTSCVQSRRSPS